MVRLLQLKILIILCLFFAASCAPASPTSEAVSTFSDSDPEFEEAVRQAQNTLHIFRQAIISPKSSYALASLKIRFTQEGQSEDMWTEPIYILDDVYTVRMVEGVPLKQGIHPDRLVDVKLQDIVDWMLLEEDGTVIGGYTLRLDYERMTPEEQEKYLELTGYRFE
jgi:uncharacterized protein YegJ (DUF2314 family)